MKNIIFFLLFMNIVSLKLFAQDPQYSQFYANALYLSPAFAGAEGNTRAIFASRYQWPALNASFISSTVSIDHYIPQYNSGVGLIINSDASTAANINSTEIGGIYAYQVELRKHLVFRPALQVSYVSRSINFNKLTFGSQYNDNGFQGGSTGENNNQGNINYADVSTGGLIYAKNYWVGFSSDHLNSPNQSFIHGESPLPVKTSFFGGYKFSSTPEWAKRYNPNEEKSITPTFLYKMQGKSDQFDLGLYARYNNVVFGMWYRGIPIKLYKPERTNNESFIFLAGFIKDGFKIGYSFDYTISKLTMASGGAHEITLSYEFKNKKKKKIQKRPVCPKF